MCGERLSCRNIVNAKLFAGSDASRSRRTSRSDAGRSPSSSAGNPEENSSKAGTGSSRKKLDGDEAASSRRGTASGGGGGGDGGGGKGGDDSDDDDNADQAWEAGAEAAESWEAQGLNDEDDWDLDSLSDVEEYDLVDDDDAGRLATEKPDEATTAPSASATGAAGRDARDDSAASIPTGTAQVRPRQAILCICVYLSRAMPPTCFH